nr:hypothetical protein [Mycobacterium lepraemurium]
MAVGVHLGTPVPSSGPSDPAGAVRLRVLDDGVFVGSSAAPITLDIFNKPICPPCGSSIRSNAADIDAAVNSRQLAVRYHLLNFLDDKSRSQNYSTRAVAATYCVAAQRDANLYTELLFGPVRQQLSAPRGRRRGPHRRRTRPTGQDGRRGGRRDRLHQVRRRDRHRQDQSGQRLLDAVRGQRQLHPVHVGRHQGGEL